jgi:hypothetical protein
MLQANVKIIAELKDFVQYVFSHKDVLDRFTFTAGDFSRKRKLPFSELVLLIARLCKKTLSVELNSFFREMGSSMQCSVSAFTQQRCKLNASFFYYWNVVLWLCYYKYYGSNTKRWKGHRLIAMDGSSVSLINTKALGGYFGGQSNQYASFSCAKTFYCYDILNELVLYSDISPYRVNEQRIAWHLIEYLSPDMIAIYDRNFCNFKTVALHMWQEKEIKFVIRASETPSVVKDFIASGKSSSLVKISPSEAGIRSMKKSGYQVNKQSWLEVRLVRVEVNDFVEVLMTNLWESEGYKTSEFKDLYFQRWAIETSIGFQKNVLQLESFSGLTVQSVKQDFYATVFMANLHSILIKDAQRKLNHNKKGKYPRKVNKNKSYGHLKTWLVSVFICQSPLVIIKKLVSLFLRDALPVRKGRSFTRIRKHTQSNSKYKTYSNFKPAY